MFLGFGLTQHCNLRCPHCIKDDVRTVRALSLDLVRSVLDQALALYGDVEVSLTGGEPLLHAEFAEVVALFGTRGVPWRMVSNGWHVGRALGALTQHPPRFVRLSLSGASEAVHDAERGRGSFRRVLLAIGLLRSRGIPASLSLVVDRRDRHELRAAADLAESLGALDLHVILPQPVPSSAARGTDLPPAEWLPVRREVEALAAEPGRRTAIVLDYGAPADEGEAERPCDAKLLRRLFVDERGRLVTCCQLSGYGGTDTEVVADLTTEPLAAAVARYEQRIAALVAATRPDPDSADPFDRFPCMRCARHGGKLAWLAQHQHSPWRGAVGDVAAAASA